MENKRYYGIDVGGTTVKIGLFEGERLLDKWSVPTDTSHNGANILTDIIDSLPGPADGAALAVPGAVLPDGTVNRCVNLGWGVCHPAAEFTVRTGIPCRVLNDANAAALGEQRLGGGKGFESVLFVALGTGVGAGVVLDGHLRVGARGAAGEIGHLCIDPEEPEACGCGNHGCLEQYCSATGVCRLAEQEGLHGYTCAQVFDMAKTGDPRASRAVDRACDALGKGIASVCAVVDPEAVVLGGGVALAGEFLRLKVIDAFHKYAFHACRGTEMRLASLGSDAGLIGAALYAMDVEE